MTVTVVYKSPFPWTVSASLFLDETTAISSSSAQSPILSAWLFFFAKIIHTQQMNIVLVLHTFQTIWFAFRQREDGALLMLIKDDVSEMFSISAKHWLSVGSDRQMSLVNRVNV